MPAGDRTRVGLDLRERCACGRLLDRIRCVICDGLLRLFESFFLLSEPGISEGKSARKPVRLGRDDRIGCRLDTLDRAGETLLRLSVPPSPFLAKP